MKMDYFAFSSRFVQPKFDRCEREKYEHFFFTKSGIKEVIIKSILLIYFICFTSMFEACVVRYYSDLGRAQIV